MSKIFKPRRGTTYTMNSTDRKNTVLAKGEFFLEVPNTGAGTGPSKIKIGDGVTPYENLPVALSGTTTSDVTNSSATSVTSALNNVVSGTEMSVLFGNLKRAVSLNQTAISQLNDDMPFAFAIQDGQYGYKKSDGTFKSFRSQSDVDGAIADAMVGTAQAAQVLIGYSFTNSEASDIDGTMPNQGSKQYTINPGGQQNIPAGYHDGTGYVKANPNTNSTTYTFSSGSGGTVDLGINNTVRYVNASSVYNYGYNLGYNSHTFTITPAVGMITREAQHSIGGSMLAQGIFSGTTVYVLLYGVTTDSVVQAPNITINSGTIISNTSVGYGCRIVKYTSDSTSVNASISFSGDWSVTGYICAIFFKVS